MDTSMLNRWKALPKDIILAITNRIDSRVDILSLRAVCRPFREMFPLPPKTILANPTLKFPFPECSFSDKRGHFLLTESTVYAIQPLNKITNTYDTTKTWFFKLQQSVFNPHTVRVKDPLSRYVIDSLPRRMPESLNMLDYRVKEVALCTRPDKEGLQFSIMTLITKGRVGVWRSEFKRWDYIRFGDTYFVDVIYHKEEFYALGTKGEIISVDCKSLEVSKHASLMMKLQNGSRRLLEVSNELYLIEKLYVDVYNHRGFSSVEDCGFPFRCKVFKLDQEKHRWVGVKELGAEDRVFFVGDDCSFSVSAKEFPGCKPKCIYFAENMFDRSRGNNDYPGADSGVYDFEDNFSGPLWGLPCYSKLFWPLPRWLSQVPEWAGI
ncbi:F-box protein SKIP23-like [Melia azedarach]|uniref:F-box protein SKIP23-like n=1 Tax=Melia azedarach TaxID=155640 RepID=A0ACC1XTP2_MELAZ|nr:F-box protein SKIP23-like [Melia azedarach]